MRWSKLKQQVEARFAPALQNRLTVELTKYNKPSKSELGEFFVLLDKAKIFSASEAAAYRDSNHQYYRRPEEFDAIGITTEFRAPSDLRKSLSWSISEFLSQPNPLLRGLAIADSRFGKRRIEQIAVGEEPAFVQAILYARGAVDTSTEQTPGR